MLSVATWTEIVTGITFLLGVAICAKAGFHYQQRTRGHWREWPLPDDIVQATSWFWMGIFVLHIALSRIYHDGVAYHLFDLNSIWAAVIRAMAIFVVLWSMHRMVDPLDK